MAQTSGRPTCGTCWGTPSPSAPRRKGAEPDHVDFRYWNIGGSRRCCCCRRRPGLACASDFLEHFLDAWEMENLMTILSTTRTNITTVVVRIPHEELRQLLAKAAHQEAVE